MLIFGVAPFEQMLQAQLSQYFSCNIALFSKLCFFSWTRFVGRYCFLEAGTCAPPRSRAWQLPSVGRFIFLNCFCTAATDYIECTAEQNTFNNMEHLPIIRISGFNTGSLVTKSKLINYRVLHSLVSVQINHTCVTQEYSSSAPSQSR